MSVTAHPRAPGITADLLLGWHHWLTFAAEAGAISAAEKAEYWKRASAWIQKASEIQAQEILEQDQAQRFLALLTSAIRTGHAYVTAPNGAEPSDPMQWGWARTSTRLGAPI